MNLEQTQNEFVKAVLKFEHDGITPEILETKDISPESRISIYRNNTQGAVTKAMELTYPVVNRLVGEQFFTQTCIEFLKQYHPITGNLDDFGGEFAEFLNDFPPAQQLPYLPDIARLEWLFHESSIAPKSNIIDQSALSNIPQDKFFNLHMTMQSSLRLMKSDYPVHKIWQINQDDYNKDKTINLDEETGVFLLIIRHNMKTNLVPLIEAEYCFLKALASGSNFYDSFSEAVNIDEEFDLAHYIQKHIAGGSFSGFTVG